MVYYTMPRRLEPIQISILDILEGRIDETNVPKVYDKSYTITHKGEMTAKMRENTMYPAIEELKRLILKYSDVFDVEDINTMYRHFKLPKKTHGWRSIQVPEDRLKQFQYELMKFFKEFATVDMYGCHFALHHTSGFGYVVHRCTKDQLIRHTYNDSKWYAKTDFSDFFGTTSLDFVISQLKLIYPICSILDMPGGEYLMRTALSVCFPNGRLPQGTPISPMLTNLIMIPIDHELANMFHAKDRFGRRFVYTRYADDILISSKSTFSVREKVNQIRTVLDQFGAPYEIKDEKTRYGSRNGSNWNLGLMINKDNNITIGSKNINKCKVMIHNFILDHLHDKRWSRLEVEQFQGKLNYYRTIQPERINEIIDKYNKKHGVDLIPMIKMVLKMAV